MFGNYCRIMKNILYLFITLFVQSYSNKTYQKFDYNYSKNPWINAFKDQLFFASLKEGFNSDSIFTLLKKKDAFNPYDWLSLDELEKAKALGKDLVKKITPHLMCEDWTPGMNYYMANALHYYNSRELDSIARVYYKQHLKKDKQWWKCKIKFTSLPQANNLW